MDMEQKRERERAYYASNRERIIQLRKERRKANGPRKLTEEQKAAAKVAQKAWYEANKETQKQKARQYYYDNLEVQKELSRKRALENPERTRNYGKKWRAENPEKTREHHRKGNHLRRVRMYDGQYERFDYLEIFERDGWVCQLCLLPIDQELKWPDLMSVSLDHIVPVSKGGNHVRDNVQAAHLGCNMSKGPNGSA